RSARRGIPTASAACAACFSETCCSIDLTPRALVDINLPIAVIQTPIMASAINTSMTVKPASARSVCCGAVNNLASSGQPVDANLVTGVGAPKCNRPAARHAVCKEIDCREDGTLPAALRQQRIKLHILWNSKRVRCGAGAYRP